MKKRLVIMTLCAVLSAVSLSGCQNKENEAAAPEKAPAAATAAATDESGAAASSDENAQDKYGPIISELDLDKYITLGEYKGLTLVKEDVEPTDEEVQDEIDIKLDTKATEKEVTGRPIQSGDIANIDFEGKKDGVAFDGGTSQGFDLTIGSGTFIPGFEDGLIGAEIGETRDLNLTFPENYGAADLAGADVVFTVKVNSIKEKEVPELTDELAKELDESVSTADELREKIRDDLRASKESDQKGTLMDTALNMAVENAEIKEIPEGLIEEQVDIAVMQANSYAASMQISTEEFMKQYYGTTLDEFKQQYREYAQTGAKQMLTIFAIAKAEGLMTSVEDSKSELETYMGNLGYDDFDKFMNTVDGRGCYEYLHFDKISQFLYDNANIS